MRLIIDRIEKLSDGCGGFAVCEIPDDNGNYRMIDISLDRLPCGVKAGDVLEEVCGKFTVARSCDDAFSVEKLRARLEGLCKK